MCNHREIAGETLVISPEVSLKCETVEETNVDLALDDAQLQTESESDEEVDYVNRVKRQQQPIPEEVKSEDESDPQDDTEFGSTEYLNDGAESKDEYSLGDESLPSESNHDDKVSTEKTLAGESSEGESSAWPAEFKKRKKKNPPQPKIIPCEMCEELFRTQRSLMIHKRIVHGKEPSKECEICGKKFSSVGNLTQHKHTHSDSRRYICS